MVVHPSNPANTSQSLLSSRTCTTLQVMCFDAADARADQRSYLRMHADGLDRSPYLRRPLTPLQLAQMTASVSQLTVRWLAVTQAFRFLDWFVAVVRVEQGGIRIIYRRSIMIPAGDVVLEKRGFSGVSYEFRTISLTAGRLTSRLVRCCISAIVALL